MHSFARSKSTLTQRAITLDLRPRMRLVRATLRKARMVVVSTTIAIIRQPISLAVPPLFTPPRTSFSTHSMTQVVHLRCPKDR